MRAQSRYFRGLLGALLAVAATAASAAPAMAQSVPPDNSGVDQYVPSAPAAGGPQALRPGRGGGPLLDPSIAAQLGGGDKLLGQLATDTGLGAPDGGASGANASASIFDGELLALLAVLAAIGAGGLALLMRRRRDDGGPAG